MNRPNKVRFSPIRTCTLSFLVILKAEIGMEMLDCLTLSGNSSLLSPPQRSGICLCVFALRLFGFSTSSVILEQL